MSTTKKATAQKTAAATTTSSIDTQGIENVVASLNADLSKPLRKRLYKVAKWALPIVGVAASVTADLADVIPPKVAVIATSAFLVASAVLHGIADSNTDLSESQPLAAVGAEEGA